jgi:glutamine amidotransferase
VTAPTDKPDAASVDVSQGPQRSVVVIDYGMGNLRSIGNALRAVGADVLVSQDPAAVASAERLVLPGVGAFGMSMHELGARKLLGPILDAVQAGRPLLGICLGYQVLFERSNEHGEHAGMGLFEGSVERFDQPGLIVPHMGWNRILFESSSGPPHPVLEGLSSGAFVYFVHSYRSIDVSDADALTRTDYGELFVSGVARDNLVGFQFHPEKSGPVGLRILRNFLSWSP